MIIDAHHHLWRYSPEEYGWIGEGMQALARDFSASDLADCAKPLGVAGSVAVQARQSLEETTALLNAAAENPFLLGVVGWAPIAESDFESLLDELTANKKLKGLRHVVQDEPDEDFLLRKPFNDGVSALLQRGLVYDILIFERHLPQTIQFVDNHPGGRFVLDHIAKPRIAAGEIKPWRERLKDLASRENVCCKLSGIVTEADWSNWSLDSIRPYMDAALEAFGPSRLMFGSDWPVCTLAAGYKQWIDIVKQWAEPLSNDERDWLFWRSAAAAYGLEMTG